MTTTDLKECPFCGGEAKERVEDDGPGFRLSIVRCTKCPAEIAITDLDARQHWNARPTAAPDEMLADEIYGLLRSHKLQNLADEYGDPYPLVDAVTPDGAKIDIGMEELRLIADEVAGLRRPQQPADWRPINEAPKDQTRMIRWHRMWGPITVYRNNGSLPAALEWITACRSVTWPEDAFLPFFMELSNFPAPPAEGGPKNG